MEEDNTPQARGLVSFYTHCGCFVLHTGGLAREDFRLGHASLNSFARRRKTHTVVVIADRFIRMLAPVFLSVRVRLHRFLFPGNPTLYEINSTDFHLFRLSIGCGTSVVIGDGMLDKDLNLKEKLTRIFDRTAYEALALLLAQSEPERIQTEPPLEWMTASQLARYWQLVNAQGEPTTAAIMKWTKRAETEHPLPHACMGDLLRFKREEVDRWAQEEAVRRRSENARKKIQLAS